MNSEEIMRAWTLSVLILILTAAMLSGCGPSEEEKRRAEQARQDSLEQVRQQKMAKQRRDSIAQARADSLAESKSEANGRTDNTNIDVNFDPEGTYSVQVESWRSKRKAQSQVGKWKDRGFSNAFVVQYSGETSGDVWFRVRLGRLSSRQAAEDLRQQLKNKYDAASWISSGA